MCGRRMRRSAGRSPCMPRMVALRKSTRLRRDLRFASSLIPRALRRIGALAYSGRRLACQRSRLALRMRPHSLFPLFADRRHRCPASGQPGQDVEQARRAAGRRSAVASAARHRRSALAPSIAGAATPVTSPPCRPRPRARGPPRTRRQPYRVCAATRPARSCLVFFNARSDPAEAAAAGRDAHRQRHGRRLRRGCRWCIPTTSWPTRRSARRPAGDRAGLPADRRAHAEAAAEGHRAPPSSARRSSTSGWTRPSCARNRWPGWRRRAGAQRTRPADDADLAPMRAGARAARLRRAARQPAGARHGPPPAPPAAGPRHPRRRTLCAESV